MTAKIEAAIERIATPLAPQPAGHYAQAAAYRDLVFVSGQLPVRPDGGHGADLPFEAQVRQVLANMVAILAAADSGLAHLLKVTVYIAGVEHWPAFDRIYAEVLGEACPARAVVPVPALHHGYLVEIEAIATRRGAAANANG